MADITSELARFAASAEWDDLPDSIIHDTKLMLMDHIGCALGAHSTKRGRMSAALAENLGGTGDASVIGGEDKVSCDHAVYANGELMITLDYSQIVAGGHDGVYIIPTPLAFAERTGASGKELILAIAVAHEISARLGRALGKNAITSEAVRQRQEREHPGPTGNAYSNFGAAAGAGRLLDMTDEKMLNALGLSGHMTQILQYTRWAHTDNSYMAKYGTPGWQQTGAVKSALLADMGYTGDSTLLDDPEHGFTYISGFNYWDPDEITSDLGDEWIFNIRMHFKPYPCCGFFHSALDCFYSLLDEHQLEPEEIDHVTAYLQEEWQDFPSEGIAGLQFDPSHAFAAAVHDIPRGPLWYDPETLTDPAIERFKDKVTTAAYPGYAEELERDPLCAPGKVEVEARGRTFSAERQYRRGTNGGEAMLTDTELADKFRRNAEFAIPQQQTDRAIDLLMNLEDVDNVRTLMQEVTL